MQLQSYICDDCVGTCLDCKKESAPLYEQDHPTQCYWCGKQLQQVRKLYRGPCPCICDSCNHVAAPESATYVLRDVRGVYTRLTGLLGQPLNSPAFRQFVEDFKLRAHIDSINNEDFYCALPQLGVILFTRDRVVDFLIVHIDSPSTKTGYFKPYPGDLPMGITAEDRIDVVQKKFAKQPVRSAQATVNIGTPRDLCEEYQLPPLYLSFHFDGVTKQMCLVGIARLAHGGRGLPS